MTTFVIYFIFVGIQIGTEGKNWLILLQAPISFVFSMLLNVLAICWISSMIACGRPAAASGGNRGHSPKVVMTVNMKLVPNPADDGLADGRRSAS